VKIVNVKYVMAKRPLLKVIGLVTKNATLAQKWVTAARNHKYGKKR